MLPKFQRLNLKKEYRPLQSGKKASLPSFNLMFKLEGDKALVGIALSKRSFALSTQRNRARRLSSQAIQKLYPSLPKGVKLVIIPKTAVLDRSVESLEKELKSVKDLFTTD